MRPLTIKELSMVSGGADDIIVVTGTRPPPPPPPGGVGWGDSYNWWDHDSAERDKEAQDGKDDSEDDKLTDEEVDALSLLNQAQQLLTGVFEDLKGSVQFVFVNGQYYHIDDVIKYGNIAGNLGTALEVMHHIDNGDYAAASTSLAAALGGALVAAGVTAATGSVLAGAGAGVATGIAITASAVGIGFVINASVEAYQNIPPAQWTEGDGTPNENYQSWWNDYFGVPNLQRY